MSAEALWARLAGEGLVEGRMPAPDRNASPWFVRLMLGIAGWIGAVFLMIFVAAALAFVMRDAASAAVAGLLCCGTAFILLRSLGGNDFAEQFGLVVSLVGQILIGIGLSQMMAPQDPPFFLAMAGIEAVLALALPNFLHRLLATCGAAIALGLAINQLHLHGLAAPLLCFCLAWIWLEPARWARGGRIWRPVGYGLVLALLLVESFRLFGAELLFGMASSGPSWIALHGPLIGRAVTAAILVWVALALALREGFPAGGRVTLAAGAAAILFGLLSLGAPGFASALLILLLGFAAGNRLLLALGIVGLLGFAGHLYYSLHLTLLEKSGLLALTGILLLAAHWLLRRFAGGDGETAHA